MIHIPLLSKLTPAVQNYLDPVRYNNSIENNITWGSLIELGKLKNTQIHLENWCSAKLELCRVNIILSSIRCWNSWKSSAKIAWKIGSHCENFYENLSIYFIHSASIDYYVFYKTEIKRGKIYIYFDKFWRYCTVTMLTLLGNCTRASMKDSDISVNILAKFKHLQKQISAAV